MEKVIKAKKEDETEKILGKSSMYVSIATGYLGIIMTLFILILTINPELLDSKLISYQLVLSIPLSILHMVSRAKMIDFETTRDYYDFNKITSGLSFAFFYNALGLLISKNVEPLLATLFFIVYLLGVSFFIYTDLEKRNFKDLCKDILLMALIILGGVLPTLGVISF